MPGGGGRYYAKLVSELDEPEREAVASWEHSPRVVDVKGIARTDWSYLEFEHGRIYNVAIFRTEDSRLVHTRPEIVTKPAVVTVPMRYQEGANPSFLSMVEERVFAHDVVSSPHDLYGNSRPVSYSFVTVPQGHAQITHSALASEEEEKSGFENLTHAHFREMLEEAGYRGTGRFKHIGSFFRDQSFGASQVSFLVAEVSPAEKARRLGRDLDSEESIGMVGWFELETLLKMCRSWRDWRAYTAVHKIREYLEGDFREPNTRFDGEFDLATL